jgi:hypothetical protein
MTYSQQLRDAIQPFCEDCGIKQMTLAEFQTVDRKRLSTSSQCVFEKVDDHSPWSGILAGLVKNMKLSLFQLKVRDIFVSVSLDTDSSSGLFYYEARVYYQFRPEDCGL